MHSNPIKAVSVALLAMAGVVVGCNKEEPVRAYQAPKEVAQRVPAGSGDAPGATAAPASADGAGAQASSSPDWTVPAGWKELPAQQMRFATFAVAPDKPEVVLTVVPLGGGSGTVAANVNRWEGQLGLPPTPADQIDKVVQHVDSNGLHIDVVDLEGPGASAQPGQPKQRMLAAILPAAGRTWFFKLMGPADMVAGQKANFDAFIRSVRFGGEQGGAVAHAAPGSEVSTAAVGPNGASASAPAVPPPAAAGKPLSWGTLPAGWSEVPNVQPPRMAAFKVGGGAEQADLVVTRFPGSAIGSFADNVNRWRGQLGLPPAPDVSSYGPKTVTLGGQPWTIVDVAGEEQGGKPAQGMLVGMITRGQPPQTWFFKLQGPAKLLADQRPAFEKFLETVRFGTD